MYLVRFFLYAKQAGIRPQPRVQIARNQNPGHLESIDEVASKIRDITMEHGIRQQEAIAMLIQSSEFQEAAQTAE